MADGGERYECWCKMLKHSENIHASEVNWTEITEAMIGLTKATKSKTFRSQVSGDVLLQCKDITDKSFSLQFGKRCAVKAHVFRFLRNCCVESQANQDYIILIGLLPLVIESLENGLKHLPSLHPNLNASTDGIKQLLDAGIQLLGNLVTGNENNQNLVWEKCYHTFFQSIMDCDFDQTKNYVCMVIYNCMKRKHRPEMVSTSEGITLTNSIVKMCCKNEKHIEWGIYILELLLQSGCFRRLYDTLDDNHHRVFVLNLIEEKFKTNEEYEFWKSWVTDDNLCHLAQVFEEHVAEITNSKINLDVEETSHQMLFVSSLLRLLCFLTSFPERFVELRNRLPLLQNTLFALRETSTAKNKAFFSNVTQFPTNDNDSSHPVYGFKKNLVRLIGNMCYRNETNQDCVRNMDCIPLLLDHCNIDLYNPYICQWAIFSLRNILEENEENKEIVKSLKKLGLAKNERLIDTGFTVEETGSNRIRIATRTSTDEG